MENISNQTAVMENNLSEPELASQTTTPQTVPLPQTTTAIQDVEGQKLQLERDKLKLEKTKAWIMGIAIVVPLITAMLTAMLTYVLTNNTNKTNATRQLELDIKKAELQREYTFADLINKDRLTRIAEVWAQADKYVATVEKIMKPITETTPDTTTPDTPKTLKISASIQKEDIEDAKTLHKKCFESLAANRFWLEDEIHNEIKKYVDTTYDYFVAKLKAENTEALERARNESRNSLKQLREKLLKGQL
jgi:hypothetical protein